MRIAFMGAPAFALPTLAELVAARHEIAMVYTQPPRPAGRGQAERPGPVHALAVELGLPVRTPASFKSAEEQAAFAALGLDIAVVVAYGLILPPAMLAAPRLSCVNLHASLLPRWRGAAPIQRAVMAGDEVTGVEVMQMTPGLDEGPILLSETVRIFPFDTAGSLHDRLAEVGAQLMARALAALERGALAPTPQASDGVTYAKKIDKAEARIDWARPAVEIDRQIRGLSPFPGAWFELARDGGKPMRVKALACRLEPDAEVGAAAPGAAAPGAAAPGAATPGEATPGEALDDRLLIATADGAVRLTRLQREGRRAQEADEFLRGAPTPAGTRLA